MIFRGEEKALQWLEKHIWAVAVPPIVLLGVYARYCLRDFVSIDYTAFLEPWYQQIQATGLGQQVGDYNMPYQFLIFLMTKLPLPPLDAYKVVSCFFDCLLALAAGGGVIYWLSGKRWETAMIAGAAVFCSPIVILNSAGWAQCDSIYTFFVVSALLALLVHDRPLPAFLLLGAAVAFKLQAVFVLPFFLLLYLVTHRFSAIYFSALPAMMLLLSAPCIVSGRRWQDVFTIYSDQTGTYGELMLNYPSFWTFWGTKSGTAEDISLFSAQLRPLLMAFCLVVLGIGCCLLARNTAWRTAYGKLYLAFLSVYTCVLLLPSMHERYGYCYEVLSILLAVLCPRTAKWCVALHLMTLVTYSNFLLPGNMLGGVDLHFLAAANVAVYLLYVTDFVRHVCLPRQTDTGAPQAGGQQSPGRARRPSGRAWQATWPVPAPHAQEWRWDAVFKEDERGLYAQTGKADP